jgi:hypothetical protein
MHLHSCPPHSSLLLPQINQDRNLADVAHHPNSQGAAIDQFPFTQRQPRRRILKPEDVAPCSGPLLQIFQLGHTKTLERACMNALYVPTRSAGTQRYGLVGHVGQSSILVVSRDGPKTKVQPCNNNNNNIMRTEHCLHRSNGGALDATYQKTSCHRHTLVGAKKSWIQRSLAGFRLIHVVRHVAKSGNFPKSAHTDAT